MRSPLGPAASAVVPAVVSVPCCRPFSLPQGPGACVEVPASAPLVLGPASRAAQQDGAINRTRTVYRRVRQLLSYPKITPGMQSDQCDMNARGKHELAVLPRHMMPAAKQDQTAHHNASPPETTRHARYRPQSGKSNKTHCSTPCSRHLRFHRIPPLRPIPHLSAPALSPGPRHAPFWWSAAEGCRWLWCPAAPSSSKGCSPPSTSSMCSSVRGPWYGVLGSLILV